jgi:hypothetical protein
MRGYRLPRMHLVLGADRGAKQGGKGGAQCSRLGITQPRIPRRRSPRDKGALYLVAFDRTRERQAVAPHKAELGAHHLFRHESSASIPVLLRRTCFPARCFPRAGGGGSAEKHPPPVARRLGGAGVAPRDSAPALLAWDSGPLGLRVQDVLIAAHEWRGV